MKTVVKSNGEIEVFSEDKLRSCLETIFKMLKTPDGLAKQFTDQTLADFTDWQKDKLEITSADIRRTIARILGRLHPDAAYLFKNFKSII